MKHSNKETFAYFLFFSVCSINWLGAVDHSGPYRPLSEGLERDQMDLRGLDEAAYASMSLDDIRLHNAYVSVLQTFRGGQLYAKDPEHVGALANLRKRSDTATPLLLKLLNENQETGFEVCLLINISAVRSLNLKPYLD
jgi:hypothetical protein